ncbi:nucleoside hydrolase [Microlunatus antarcticus]|uniref:Inosine-uridine nucleoside N-ribohydrolase n=1 Tax=Microlunatus antarcticus TaxID=53388 RepID=A0A7W5JZ04_9ACTN|nr:nucleoside hydrolase [Microlunatus antarcticus]MBB3328848.1 inosine-uridine nucleoside N-ribohydrolase [Microlunatus antarcticus]
MPQRRRVIVDTDAKNEADDQYAIVHALLSPTLDVRGIVPAHFGTERSATSMLDSRAEVDLLLQLMGLEGSVTVANGAERGIADESTPAPSAGADLIVAESRLSSAEDPLFVAFLGPLTDMATAILTDPEIVHRDVVVVWIGGMGHDVDWSYDGIEFNLRNDIAAANVVFGSGITVWQIPATVYTMVSVGYAELEERIGGTSKLADYLIEQLVEFNDAHHPEPIESRSLGDSPAISVILNPRGGVSRTVPAPRFGSQGGYLPGSGHPVRVFDTVDVRYLLEDMFAKLCRFGRTQA